MDFDWPVSAQELRSEAAAWLDANLAQGWGGTGTIPVEEMGAWMIEWRAKLVAGGWLAMTWPREYGARGVSEIDAIAAVEEFARRGVPSMGTNDAFSIGMLGNTLLRFGSEDQKRHFIPRILSGEDIWCQGYSEPEAGSDLAGVRTRAMLDGDEWVINGQKLWTSSALLANWIFVVARTDPDVPKHRGISFLLVPMDQPGVEVRPIKMMAGGSEFNEVFFTDARTSRDHMVGEVNAGWRVAMSLLGFERGTDAAVTPMQFRRELDRLIELARGRGVLSDPAIREQIVKAHERVEIMRYMGLSQLTKFARGHDPGPDGAVTKVWWSEHHIAITELAMDILGMDGLVAEGRRPASVFRTDDPGAPNSTASWQTVFLNARAGTIYAGTSQIQRNIIGEMILGLPKEPSVE